MPIRTRHGRAGAYRGWWQWPLRNRTRALVTGALTVALLGGLGMMLGNSDDGTAGPTAAPSTIARPGNPSTGWRPDTSTPATSNPAQGSTATPEPAPSTPGPPDPATSGVDPAAMETATAWASAWTHTEPGMTNQQWRDQLGASTTEEYLAQLSTVDITRIPATRVTGPPDVVDVQDGSATLDVPTDGVRLRLQLIATPAGWRVTAADKAP